MIVKRVVANLTTDVPSVTAASYRNLLELDGLMDQGWIVTLGSKATARVQMSLASEGGSGTPVPDLSIEVDDPSEVLVRAASMQLAIEYGPTSEPWGVRRFHIRDPEGRLLNILSHEIT